MELVKGLLEKYPIQEEVKDPIQEVKGPTHEEVKEALDNADTGSSIPETIRNLGIDIASGAALGAAGSGIKAKFSSKKPAQAATREAVEILKSGKDDLLGHWRSLMKKGASDDSLVRKMMEQNKNAAKSVAEGGNGKKALKTVIKNTQREAEIGPRFINDIQMILQNNAGLSEKEVKKVIKDFIKENADNVDLITLLEAKEPIATYSHSLGVQDLTYRLAKKAGLGDKKARKISEAALVHDIGKIQVPDSIISTSGIFSKNRNLKKWMDGHDITGEDILRSDPFKAKVAKGHHPAQGHSDGSLGEGLVTVADIYEAMTSNKRSYKPGKSMEEALEAIEDNVKNGRIKKEYYDLIKALYDDGLLKESYNYTSPLEDAYKSMKANEIIKQVGADYNKEFFNRALKKDLPKGMSAGALVGGVLGVDALNGRTSDNGNLDDATLRAIDLTQEALGGYKPFKGDEGGVQSSSLPSLSEIISAFSPSFRTKAEKLDDIKRWYDMGFTNDEIDRLIVNTDFKDNKQVTKLWKLMNDQFKD